MAFISGFSGGFGVSGGFQVQDFLSGASFGAQAPAFGGVSAQALFGTELALTGGWGNFLGGNAFNANPFGGSRGDFATQIPLDFLASPSGVGGISGSFGAPVGFGTASAVGAIFGGGGFGVSSGFGFPGFSPHLGQAHPAFGGFPGFSPHLGQAHPAFGGFPGFSPHLGQAHPAFGGFPGFPPHLAQAHPALGGFSGFPPHLAQPHPALGGLSGFPPHLAQPHPAFGHPGFGFF